MNEKKNAHTHTRTHAREGIKVAVYGTLMLGERNARWRDGIPTAFEATVEGRLFDTGYGFPAIEPAEGAGKVAVEILETDAEGVAKMDILEGYPNLYRRETVSYTGTDGRTGEALVYVMNRLPPTAVVIEPKDGIADWRVHRLQRLI